MRRAITAIVVHHSASPCGDRDIMDSWHRVHGWSGIAFHRVILNGCCAGKGEYLPGCDGAVQQGRPDDRPGAHVKPSSGGPPLGRGWNRHSLGICLIGDLDESEPTARQWASLVDTCTRICECHGLPASRIYGHREAAPGSTDCPGENLDMDRLRVEVAAKLFATGG